MPRLDILFPGHTPDRSWRTWGGEFEKLTKRHQYLPREVLVGELCDANVGKHGQPVPHIVLVVGFWFCPIQQTDAAQDALLVGARHDLGDWVGEDAHAEEGDEDGPVELVEQGQLRPALNHQAAISKADEDDAEKEVEEEGVDVDVGHHLPHHLQHLAPEQPWPKVLFILRLDGWLEGKN